MRLRQRMRYFLILGLLAGACTTPKQPIRLSTVPVFNADFVKDWASTGQAI